MYRLAALEEKAVMERLRRAVGMEIRHRDRLGTIINVTINKVVICIPSEGPLTCSWRSVDVEGRRSGVLFHWYLKQMRMAFRHRGLDPYLTCGD